MKAVGVPMKGRMHPSTSASRPPSATPPMRPAAPLSHAAAAACAAAAAAMIMAAAPPSAMAVLPPGKASLTPKELVEVVRDDFVNRHYLVTGNLTKEIYSPTAHFADARDDFGNIGPDKWSSAVGFLFDGEKCKLKLTGDVVYDDATRTITVTSWRQVDYFRLPGSPHTPVYTGHTTLTLDPVDNLVVDHIETWDSKPEDVTGQIKFFDSNFNPPGFD